MKTIYLAGPINNCSDSECRDWREAFKVARSEYRYLDPMVRDYRGREEECYREIVELDKADIDASDILVVNYDKPSVGTSMEILYAWQARKPVYIVAAPGVRISPWLRYHSTKILASFEEAYVLLRC